MALRLQLYPFDVLSQIYTLLGTGFLKTFP